LKIRGLSLWPVCPVFGFKLACFCHGHRWSRSTLNMFVCSAWIFAKVRAAKCLHDEDNLSSRKHFNVKML